jgi:hypothetical protein
VTNVRVERTSEMPMGLLFEAISAILDEIAQRLPAWGGFALHVDLGQAHLPDVGYVAVPIAIHVEAKKSQTLRRAIVISAARHPEAFPVFRGFLAAEESRPGLSLVRLEGTYKVPMRTFGTIVDAAVLAGVAKRALENFLDDLERAARARIEKKEADVMRHALFQHG